MATLIIGAGLVGSQIARILVEQGEKPDSEAKLTFFAVHPV